MKRYDPPSLRSLLVVGCQGAQDRVDQYLWSAAWGGGSHRHHNLTPLQVLGFVHMVLANHVFGSWWTD